MAQPNCDPLPPAQVFRALGHPARVAIVRRLGRGEQCVCALVRLCGLGWSTVSGHLAVLRGAGIVESERRGLEVYYRLRLPCVVRFIECLENPRRHAVLHAALECC